jgi:predicted nucleotidyltransferase
MASVRYVETLRLLVEAEVEFIVVGMAAGILQGAPATTLDLDIVHKRSPENVTRLLSVLQSIHAVARNDERRIAPGASHLLGPGHILLTTDNGDFDCLGTVDDNKSFEDLLPHSRSIKLDDAEVRVLDLPELIEVKRRAGRAKDRAVLPVLEATLDERIRYNRG